MIRALTYNGGGAGRGEATNGGPGTATDGLEDLDRYTRETSSRDANNGTVCCSRVCNEGVANVTKCETECILGSKAISLNTVDEDSTCKASEQA